jgi:subtilase family serine protease
MSRFSVGVTLAAAVVALVFASLGAPTVGSAVSGVRSSAAGPVADTITTDSVALPAGSVARPMPPDYPIQLTLTLASPRTSELAAFLAAVNDPGSSLYRHFLTYPEYLQEFAPNASEVGTVLAALEQAGATGWTASPDRSAILTTLGAAGVDHLLGVSLVEYGTSTGRPLYTAIGPVEPTGALRGVLRGVDGLSDALSAPLSLHLAPSELRPFSVSRLPSEFVHDNNSSSDWFVGSDYAEAYDATGLFPGSGFPNATYPTGMAVATLLAGGYNETDHLDLPPWDPAVVNSYFNYTLAPTWPKPNVTGIPVSINGVTPPLPGPFGGLNDSTLFEFENSLDLEMAGSLAPGASIYNFYFAGSLIAAASSDSEIASDFAESLAEALGHNYAPQHLAVVTGSFGLPDLNNSFWNTELGVAAATGVSVVIASGDQGNAPDSQTGRTDGQWPVWPASAAFDDSGAASVGGVSIDLAGTPTAYFNGNELNLSYDSNESGIDSMVAWYSAAPGDEIAGSEGGVSDVYSEPSWQFHSAAQPTIVNASVVQGVGSLGRAEPDVAFPANDTIATVYANQSEAVFFTVLEGTSVAAPVFAGLLADIVAVESAAAGHFAPLGFLDPALYRMASYYAAFPDPATDPILDVVDGGNYVFAAGAGWDATTGWGGLLAPRFVLADENRTITGYNYTGPTPGLPPPKPGANIPWTTIFAIFGVGIVAAVVLVVVMARPTRPRGPVGVPPGVHGAPLPSSAPSYGPGAQGGIYPGATYLCPYCGGVRPAEPVRCPQCGAF